MKKLALYLFLSLFIFPLNVQAKYNPSDRQNNKFGIHIVETNDIPDAAALVNSSGGDWGYITLVIQENDRNHDKWQRIFDQMRRLHLIPLVRLATRIDQASWAIPDSGDIDAWISFLSNLNWPTENRYVILFNEPNHAKEWGNSIQPEAYGSYVVEFAKKLRSTNDDFFILPAGLDASAGNTGATLDELQYLKRMVQKNPEFFNSIDGWTSHSYPNPGFSAPVTNRGRGSLTTYDWELKELNKLGLSKFLPVFITETGWVHSDGVEHHKGFLSPDKVAENIQIAANTVWNDSRIVAVTPFLLNYQGGPFDHFSWRKIGSTDFHPLYFSYQKLAKTKGIPRQRESYVFTSPLIPNTLVSQSKYTLLGVLKNTGQGIMSWQDSYDLTINDDGKLFTTFVEPLPILEPGQEGTIMIHIQTPVNPGTYTLTVNMTHNADSTTLDNQKLLITPPANLTISSQLGWKRNSSAAGVNVLIYDLNNVLLHKFSNVSIQNGKAKVERLTNIVPNRKYRVVMLVNRYLPRQEIIELQATETIITMRRFLPFDYNEDGKFTLDDIGELLKKSPNSVINDFIGS